MLHGTQRLLLVVDDVAIELDVTTRKKVRTEDLMNKLKSSGSTRTPMLPDGCIQYIASGNIEHFFCIRPPTTWSIAHSSVPNVFATAVVPWQLFVLKFDKQVMRSAALYFSKERISGEDTPIFGSYFPNQQEDHAYCVESTVYQAASDMTKSFSMRINKAVLELTQSAYNNHLHFWKKYAPPQISKFSLAGVPEKSPILKWAAMADELEAPWLARISAWSEHQLLTKSPFEISRDLDMVTIGTYKNILASHGR